MSSMTALLKKNNIPLSASSAFQLMDYSGLSKISYYESSTGSGQQKWFRELTEEGKAFGKNQWGHHEFKTEMSFDADAFPGLIEILSTALAKSVKESQVAEEDQG